MYMTKQTDTDSPERKKTKQDDELTASNSYYLDTTILEGCYEETKVATAAVRETFGPPLKWNNHLQKTEVETPKKAASEGKVSEDIVSKVQVTEVRPAETTNDMANSEKEPKDYLNAVMETTPKNSNKKRKENTRKRKPRKRKRSKVLFVYQGNTGRLNWLGTMWQQYRMKARSKRLSKTTSTGTNIKRKELE